MQITLEGALTLLTSAIADYEAFEAGTAVAVPEVDATLAGQKIAADLTVQKMPAGTPLTAVSLTDAITLLGDVQSFVAGSTVTLPSVTLSFAGTIIKLTLAIHKVAA